MNRSFLKFLGPGLLITVGFIDPGNWAANVAAGAQYGYALLWMMTLSTLMLILLQHNAAHLGIATGLCLSEATTQHLPRWLARPILGSAMVAAVSTALAEILGGALALNLLFGFPVKLAALLVTVMSVVFLLTNSYRRVEKLIIGFVSLIGLSFLFELWQVKVDWGAAVCGAVMPTFPLGAMPIIMSVLGAVIMPHNLFLHSEIIQSRQWNRSDETIIRRELRYEFLDTLVSMGIGWGINGAMIILAAATFFQAGTVVTDLRQASVMLQPLAGHAAALVFALALLFSGLASSITAGMAGGSICAGLFGQEYDLHERTSKAGVGLTLGLALGGILLVVRDPFQGLILSQILLGLQLPITIITQIRLTSSPKVMGTHANTKPEQVALWIVAATVIMLNLFLLISLFQSAGPV
ncbi:MAG: Nramp family divalent metal transporter [bacterium]